MATARSAAAKKKAAAKRASAAKRSTAAKRSAPGKRSKPNGKTPLNAAQKAAVAEHLEGLKDPGKGGAVIEAEQQAFFRVPGQVFVELMQVISTLPYGQVGPLMDVLKTLRAEK